jgi:hypothetical protein
MDTASSKGSALDDGIANFITIDMLKEELAVVEHYLETLPEIASWTSRRYKLSEERNQLLKMIQQQQSSKHVDREDDNSDDSTSPALSPTPEFPAVAGPSNSNNTSISGFSTPDFYSGQKTGTPFASIVEHPFHEDSRKAQELAYVLLSYYDVM